jgi:hypothetical protein
MTSAAERSDGSVRPVVKVSGGRIRGTQPNRSWNGLKPVDLLTVFMMLNQIKGSNFAQPFWFLST